MCYNQNVISPDYFDLILKLAVAVLLGAAIGLERTLAGKQAGMRTYALVALGSALFTIISVVVTADANAQGIRAFDPLRVASQVVVGIGFLGAGLIILQNDKVRGLTTAAGLWVAAGVGVATGFGLYALAAIAAMLTLTVFTVLWLVERTIDSRAGAGQAGTDDL